MYDFESPISEGFFRKYEDQHFPSDDLNMDLWENHDEVPLLSESVHDNQSTSYIDFRPNIPSILENLKDFDIDEI